MEQNAAERLSATGTAVGLVVFLAGVVMVVMVFVWGYNLFESIDDQMLSVHYAADLGPQQPAGEQPVAVANPGGPTLASVGVVLGLKFLALLVLGWLGAMVASKGAEMTGARGRSQGQ